MTFADLKYTTSIKQFLNAQASAPSDDFVKYIVGQVYAGHRTAAIIEKFKPIVKRSFTQYLNDVINDRFKTMLSDAGEELPKAEPAPLAEEVYEPVFEESNGIITTDLELEAYFMIKALLHDVIDPSRITYKDTKRYFVVLLDNRTTRWICRLSVEGKRKTITFNTSDGIAERVQIQTTDDIYTLKDKLISAAHLHTK